MAPTFDVEVWPYEANRTSSRPTSLEVPYKSYARNGSDYIGAYPLWIANFESGATWSPHHPRPRRLRDCEQHGRGPWCGFEISALERVQVLHEIVARRQSPITAVLRHQSEVQVAARTPSRSQ